MFLSKIPSLLRNAVQISVRSESGHAGIFTHKFSGCDRSHFSSSAQQQNEQQQDSTKEDSHSQAVNTSTPDKLYKKIEVEVRGNDPAVLKSYGTFAVTAANHLEIVVGRHTAPHKAIHERWTVLKSAHVHKKHRVQYEMRTYYRYIDFLRLTGSTADTFLEYLQRNLPEGVAMKVTKVELQKLPESVAAKCNA
ncbi:28S ribosomal protein S10, mitochondrial [Pseudomyrmex gracilis]|uniref:28S ribosomal protein S10, mitochondrial n=1 Tax=Pseudomyrmex gracilis TaxID=219809 RepID=UPI000995C19F|nr:28S ribosomal protein S10, mitochondrial [Pseudomyrmex gracilis]XP_020282322.1 28S ribosomal protein S10, mitochondrial [Pseudomyrmex gracilis]XP_020282323.1 28S ribosomal protein S10, mitochondrial [Pseudomyrmex gracilis]XP_020282324.1 28S ribosomal protein S10, mitochondrial [Pseudomyrmex gracilis]